MTALVLSGLLLLTGCRYGDHWPGRPPRPPRPPKPSPSATATPSPSATASPTATPTATPSETPSATPGPPEQVTLPAALPAATGLQPIGTSPAPPPGSTGGVVALTPDGHFVVWERRHDTSDDAGNRTRYPSRIGIAPPGGAATWFRPEPADPAQLRLVTTGDADGDWVVWREEPFRELPGDAVLFSYDRATGAVVELARVTGTTLQPPVIVGNRVYWEQSSVTPEANGIWSAPLAGGTPRVEVADGSEVTADRCGAEPALLYATTAADGSATDVHRRTASGDTTVLTRTLGRGLPVLGLAGCGGDVAVATGRAGALDLPEWAEGRVLVQDAGGAAVELALPIGFTGREVVLGERLLGFVTVPHSLFGAQDQVLFDRTTHVASSLGANGPGDVLQTSAVRLADADVVSWVGVVNLTFLRGTAAGYVG